MATPAVFVRRSLALALAVLLSVVSLTAASAATPHEGELTPATPSVAWQGDLAVGDKPLPVNGCFHVVLSEEGDPHCDFFDLKVAVPEDYWESKPGGGVRVRIEWPDKEDDFDLFVYWGNGQSINSVQEGTNWEEVFIAEASSGQYTVLVDPYDVTLSDYTGKATLVDEGPALPADDQRSHSGPCTKAAADSMPDGGGHDHSQVSQHQFGCRMRQVFFDSLGNELQARPDVVLGEMDIENDLAAIAVTYPESGVLFFDVSNPAVPVFLSHYRGSECEQIAMQVNCGAFVDLSSDGKLAFLAVQSLSAVSSQPPDPGVRPVSVPGVEVIDASNPRAPRLAHIQPVVGLGGVHTARSHIIPPGSSAGGARAPGEYLFSVANERGIEISRVDRVAVPAGVGSVPEENPVLVPVTSLSVSVHDMFIQNDSLTGRTYLYVAAEFESGFYMYDVTNPATPLLLAEWDLTPNCTDWYSHTIDVAIRKGRRYVTIGAETFDLARSFVSGCGSVVGNADRPGPLWIVDATDPSALGPARDTGVDAPDELQAASEAALVATWTNPADRAGGDLRFSPHNQQIVGDLIYLSHYHGGVYVLDASEAFRGKKSRPREVGFIVPHENSDRPVNTSHPRLSVGQPAIWDVVHYKGYALAADMFGGLYSLQLQR